MNKSAAEIDEEQFDRTGSIYPQPSIFDHMDPEEAFEALLHGRALLDDFDRVCKELNNVVEL